MNKHQTTPPRRAPRQGKLIFRLYIASDDASSGRALAILQAICRAYFGRNYEIEIIDIRPAPLNARMDGISRTPALLKLFPAPSWRITGDLSEDALILAAIKGLPQHGFAGQ